MRRDDPSPARPAALDEDDGATAARCYHLAGQMAGGPVRDALLAMGRDYSGRARDAARTTRFRIEQAAPRPASTRLAGIVDAITAWLMPLPAPAAARAAVPATAVTAARHPAASTRVAPAPQPAASPAPAPRRSRLFRIHALTLPGA